MTLSPTGGESGAELYRLVEAYHALGAHRTGSQVDEATREWFAAALTSRGARVERLPYGFDRFDAQAEVRIAGRQVQALPLYYEAVGDATTHAPWIAALGTLGSERGQADLAATLGAARAAGASAVVVATENPLGELQAPNRHPVPGGGLPVVLVPGREAAALRNGPVELRFSARIVPGRSENLQAEIGSAAPAPVVIATPLTGWFGCAAERGTGIALALALAGRVARRRPVLVVASTGHELLPHIGLQAYLAARRPVASLVLHLGANLALGARGADGRLGWAPTRAIGLRMAPDRFAAVAPALAPLGVPPRLDPLRWVGEGDGWARALTTPMISFAGIGPQFHTPADTPAETTSPALLATAFEAIGGAVDAWIDGEA